MIGDVVAGRVRNLHSGAEGSASDDALVASAQGDPAAFAALYVRYVDLVYRYCLRRIGNRMAAEDATSRIFERAMTALPRYRAGSFRSWLFTIAHNTITDFYRAKRTEHPLPDTWDIQDHQPGPEQQSIDADQAQRIRGLLTHLTPDQQRVLELRLAGLTDIEISQVLGRSRGSVRTIQFRAIQKLRALLASESGEAAQIGVDLRETS